MHKHGVFGVPCSISYVSTSDGEAEAKITKNFMKLKKDLPFSARYLPSNRVLNTVREERKGEKEEGSEGERKRGRERGREREGEGKGEGVFNNV